MWRKLDELKRTLSGFADQREHLLLVVSCADPELAYVIKTLEGIDDTSPADLFLTFAEPFTQAEAYAEAIMKNLRAQAAAAHARSREGASLPPFPPLCDDEAAPPHARLRAAVDHVSSLVPAEGEHRVVWAFLPLQVADEEGYARLVGQFIPWNGPEPWMRGLRVVARDDRSRPFLLPALRKRKAPGVLLYEMDMSPEALNDALVLEAADRSLPLARRTQALVQLAGLDYAYKRYPEAIKKYAFLFDHYTEHNAPAMAALSLQGVGDCLRRQGDLEGARLRYQQALTLAMGAKALPMLLGLTSALGELSLELDQPREAAGFFKLAADVAGRVMNPVARADAQEQQGLACELAGDAAGAVLVWKDAAKLCEAFDYHERRRTVLARLIAAYKAMYLDKERHACELELEATDKAAVAARAAREQAPGAAP
jgi:tetratricopeptide (TPR) repeat protein